MLRLNNIVKDYIVTKDITVNALKGISIDFRDNEFVSILGTSGCGKTTMLNIIGGLDKYTSGDLVIDGTSTKNYKEQQWNSYRNNRIGFVFQSYNLIPHLTLVENVELALTIGGIGKTTRRKMATDALIEVGLNDHINKKPNQLSGGQMQRVAIARALVNNPQIVLADEPTGALDSKTSVQVMDLLRKVAKNHLVIMVTHNAELAKTYSTRIIELSDGEVISDSDEYHAEEQETATNEKKAKTPKVKMSFLTSLSLSFKNLLTKKGRTILTSTAGSIGIIGVALVLALSNGFNNYIALLQSDTLSGFPLQISQVSYDMMGFRENMKDNVLADNSGEFPTGDNNVHVYDPTAAFDSLVHYNFLTQEYIDYIDSYAESDALKDSSERTLNGVQYSYATNLNVFAKYGDKYTMVDHEGGSTGMNPMTMLSGGNSIFQEALDNKPFVLSQYDVLCGSYPTSANQLAIVVDSYNRISVQTLTALGIQSSSTTTDGEKVYDDISFEQLIGKQFFLISHDDYYEQTTSPTYGTIYTTIDSLYNVDQLDSKLAQIVANQSALELEVTGIIRVKDTAPLELYSTGILYMPSLTTENISINKDSALWKAQDSAKEKGFVYTNNAMNKNVEEYIMAPIGTMISAFEAQGLNLSEAQAYNYLNGMTATSTVPSAISFYLANFDGKDELLSYLDDYNEGKDTNDQIIYTDATELISNSMGQMIDIISAVLIAFSSISLIVSSVMIGIITYVSVIERTKEIGVLRSLGASKANVSQVFNAESILIGLMAGLIGVGITYLISIPTNIILIAVAGGMLKTNIAALSPITALVLIAISCMLTFIASTIPARMAANLDPVKALRSE